MGRKTIAKPAALACAFLVVTAAAGAETVTPGFAHPDSFAYERVDDADSGGSDTVVVQGAKTGYSPGISESQSTHVEAETPCGDSTCLVLRVESKVPPFLPDHQEGAYDEKILARIDAEKGDIVEMTSELKVGHSVSTTTHGPFDRASTVGHFFGPWMLDLADGYREIFPRRQGQIEIAVVRREKVRGRDCFVAERIGRVGEKVVSQQTFWVDAETRHMVKVKKDGRALLLAAPTAEKSAE